MSNPVDGDPKVDARALEIVKIIDEIDGDMVKNLDLEISKKLRISLAKATAELDSGTITKLQQSIGGHIGATKNQGPRIKELERRMDTVWKSLTEDSGC